MLIALLFKMEIKLIKDTLQKLEKRSISLLNLGFGKAKFLPNMVSKTVPKLIHGNPISQLTWHKLIPELIKNIYSSDIY